MASVVIYTRQYCGFCSRAKALLDSKGVAYVEHDASFDPALRQEMMQRSGRSTFPQIFINDNHIGGCDDLFDVDAAGKLYPMLA